MKICHVINSLSGGGAETHLLDLVNAQRNEGHELYVISIGPDKTNMASLESQFQEIVNKVYRLNAPRLFNPISYRTLFNIQKKMGFDIVHTHQPRSDSMFYVVNSFLSHKPKWIVSIHGKYDTYLEGKVSFNLLKKFLMPLLVFIWSKSNHIICISSEVGTWLSNYSAGMKFSVVNYWIEPSAFQEIEDNINTINIGFLGRINKNKGIEDLLKLFTDLDNNDLQLLIGGTGKKSYLDKINDKFKLDKKSNIHFLDYVNNKREFFSKIHLFVFPSYSEGLGLVLLEAMSYSKICITRNVSPMNTILNNEIGFLFDNQSDFKEKIESAINIVKNDKSTADKKLLNQYNLLNEKYCKEVLFKKIESIYLNG